MIKAIDQGKRKQRIEPVSNWNLSERQSNRLLPSLSTERKRSLQTRKQKSKAKIMQSPDESKIIAPQSHYFLGHHHFRLTASIHYNSAHKNGEDGNPLLQILTLFYKPTIVDKEPKIN